MLLKEESIDYSQMRIRIIFEKGPIKNCPKSAKIHKIRREAPRIGF